jgi:hypothetical protein
MAIPTVAPALIARSWDGPGLPYATTSTWKATAMWMLAFGHREDRIPTRGYAGDTRGRNGRVCQELAAGVNGQKEPDEVLLPTLSARAPDTPPVRTRAGFSCRRSQYSGATQTARTARVIALNRGVANEQG